MTPSFCDAFESLPQVGRRPLDALVVHQCLLQ
jgi:hypothetical protein